MLYLIVIIHGYFFLDKPSPNEYNQTCVTKWVTKVRTRCGSVWLEHLVWDQGVAGSNPVTSINFICRCGSMVEHQPSKLNTWVRFPSPALQNTLRINLRVFLKTNFITFYFPLLTAFVTSVHPPVPVESVSANLHISLPALHRSL